MKVKELIEALKDMPAEAEVILQRDSEGNGYSPLADIDGEAVYIAEESWCGDVYNTTWTAEEADMDEDDWQEILSKDRCVVLFPV